MDLVAGALGRLPSKLLELLKDEDKLQSGVKDRIRSLSLELERAHAALRKVATVPPEELDQLDRLWARDVREASYDMEDILDSFLVRVDNSKPAEDAAKVKHLMKKMGDLFCLSKAKARHESAGTIDALSKQLEDIAKLRGRYTVDDTLPKRFATKGLDPRLSALYTKVSQLVGIDEPRDKLISMLSTVGNNKNITVLCIFGVGGLGKTTLARAMCEKLTVDNLDDPLYYKDLSPVRRVSYLKKVLLDVLIELDKGEYTKGVNLTTVDERQLISELREFVKDKRLGDSEADTVQTEPKGRRSLHVRESSNGIEPPAKWCLTSEAKHHSTDDWTTFKIYHASPPIGIKDATGRVVCFTNECGYTVGGVSVSGVKYDPQANGSCISIGDIVHQGGQVTEACRAHFIKEPGHISAGGLSTYGVKCEPDQRTIAVDLEKNVFMQDMCRISRAIVGQAFVSAMLALDLLLASNDGWSPKYFGATVNKLLNLFMFFIGRSKICLSSCIYLLLGSSGGTQVTSGDRDPAAADVSDRARTDKAHHQSTWLVASAAANHMTGNLNILTGYAGDPIRLGFTHLPHMGPMRVHGSGSVNSPNVVLQDVWYVPGLATNLVSAGQLTKLGYKVTFGPSGCRISKDGDHNVVGKARFTDEFQFEVEFVKLPAASSAM